MERSTTWSVTVVNQMGGVSIVQINPNRIKYPACKLTSIELLKCTYIIWMDVHVYATCYDRETKGLTL